MARYIDADALKERLEDFSKWCKDGRKQGVDFVLDCPLPDMPTADVEFSAEIAKEIFEEMDKIILPLLHEVSQVYIYAKLRKEYTEEKK